MKENNISINIKRKFNITFAVLKIYLSYVVVNIHCFNHISSNIKNKYLLKILFNLTPVPIFYIISYYMCYKLFITKNIKKLKNRFQRLLIPYIFWPIIIFIFNNLFNRLFEINLNISINSLIFQLLTGHYFIPVLWFHRDLIISTILMTIISLLLNKNIIFLLINISVLCYIFQYSKLNYKFFSKYNYKGKYTLGRFFEIMPYCITGYILASLNINKFLEKYRIKSIYFFTLLLFFFIKYNIFNKHIRGFVYQGIKLHIISLCVFIIFSLFPSEKIKNKNLINIIKFISNQTPGIYYMHYPIKLFLDNFFLFIQKKTFLGSLFIFIFSFCISLLGNKIFGGTILKDLFQ